MSEITKEEIFALLTDRFECAQDAEVLAASLQGADVPPGAERENKINGIKVADFLIEPLCRALDGCIRDSLQDAAMYAAQLATVVDVDCVKMSLEAARCDPENHFGQCPVCHKNDGYRHVGRDEWFFCAEHQKKWHAGSNLFSAWRGLTDEEFQQNKEFLKDFDEIEPWPFGEIRRLGLMPTFEKCKSSDDDEPLPF